MDYRSILVHLDDDPRCEERIAFAVALAAAYDSHLVGAAATGFLDFPVAIEDAATLSRYAETAWAAARDQAGRRAQRFRDECVRAALPSFEAVINETDQAESLIRLARCSDLIVLSQANPKATRSGAQQALVEEIVLYGARPTLVLPYAGTFDPQPSHIMIAWDDSREAARAVADAMPFLQRATKVHVVGWTEDAQVEPFSLQPRLEAVCRWLKRHGAQATPRVDSAREVGIASAMLSRACDLDIQLVVMGAYGHSRWKERMLGGATRGQLMAMTAPVLMSC